MSDTEKRVKKHKKSKRQETDVVDLDFEEPEAVVVKEKKEKKEKKHKKEKRQLSADEAPEDPIVIDDSEECQEKVKKHKKEKKAKKEKKEESNEDTEIPEDAPQIMTPAPKSSSAPVEVSTPTEGSTYWKRFDESKYQAKVAGTKYADNTHYSKGGDSWGNEAAEKLGKVKGQGFRKEMQKMKRASWKGAGTIDTKVNSVQFSDWDE